MISHLLPFIVVDRHGARSNKIQSVTYCTGHDQHIILHEDLGAYIADQLRQQHLRQVFEQLHILQQPLVFMQEHFLKRLIQITLEPGYKNHFRDKLFISPRRRYDNRYDIFNNETM